MGKQSRRTRNAQPHPTGANVLAPEFAGWKDWMAYLPKEHHALVGVDDRKLMEIARKFVPMNHPFHKSLHKLAAATTAVERQLPGKQPAASTEFPDWTTYCPHSVSMTMSEMLRHALAEMPKNHPERESVERRLTKVAKQNADKLATDMAKNRKTQQPSHHEQVQRNADERREDRPWEWSQPFAPYDLDEEARVLEDIRAAYEKPNTTTNTRPSFSSKHIHEMFEYGYLSKSIYDKVVPVLERTPPESRHLNLTNVLTMKEGETMVAAWEQYRKEVLGMPSEDHPSDNEEERLLEAARMRKERETGHTLETGFMTGGHLQEMFQGGFLPQSLFDKIDSAVRAFKPSTAKKLNLTDVITVEEGDQLKRAFKRYRKAKVREAEREAGEELPPEMTYEREAWTPAKLGEILKSGLVSDALIRKICLSTSEPASDGNLQADLTVAETQEWRAAVREMAKRREVETAKQQLRDEMLANPGDPTMDAVASAIIDPEEATPDMRLFSEKLTTEVKRRLVAENGVLTHAQFVTPHPKAGITEWYDSEFDNRSRTAKCVRTEYAPPHPKFKESLNYMPAKSPEPPSSGGVQVVYSEQTVPDARDGSGASGFRGAIAQALSKLNLNEAGGSATVLDFTVGGDGSMKIDTASARDLDHVSTTEELVTRVQAEVDRRDADKKRDADEKRKIEKVEREKMLYNRKRERAADTIRTFYRGWRARETIRRMRRAAVCIQRAYSRHFQRTLGHTFPVTSELLRLCKILQNPLLARFSDEKTAEYFQYGWHLLAQMGFQCEKIGASRQKQTSLDFMRRSNPVVYRSDGSADPDKVLEWVRQNEYFPSNLIYDFFMDGYALHILGEVKFRELLCGAKLFDDDECPEHMIRNNDYGWLFNRLKRVCFCLKLPEIGFEEMMDHITDASLYNQRKVYVLRAFMAIESRFGRFFTGDKTIYTKVIEDATKTVEARLSALKNSRKEKKKPKPVPSEPPKEPVKTYQRKGKKRTLPASLASVTAESAPLTSAPLVSECVVCYAEAVAPEDRAIFQCAHWVCKTCASEMHRRNELNNCPQCRHPTAESTPLLLSRAEAGTAIINLGVVDFSEHPEFVYRIDALASNLPKPCAADVLTKMVLNDPGTKEIIFTDENYMHLSEQELEKFLAMGQAEVASGKSEGHADWLVSLRTDNHVEQLQRVLARKRAAAPPPPPPPPPPPTNTHRIGDRLDVMLGTSVRARGCIVDMKFDDHGNHLCSLLLVRACAERHYIGRCVPSTAFAVARKLTDWRQEWHRVRMTVSLAGRIARVLRKWHERICARRAKEAAKLARETAPRRCKECDERKPREAYSASQWAKGDGKRTCTPCQDAAKAKAQREKDEAERQQLDELLEAECVVCYAEAVAPEDRAIFECAHWICKTCASEMHRRNELNNCPHCRHEIAMPQQYVAV